MVHSTGDEAVDDRGRSHTEPLFLLRFRLVFLDMFEQTGYNEADSALISQLCLAAVNEVKVASTNKSRQTNEIDTGNRDRHLWLRGYTVHYTLQCHENKSLFHFRIRVTRIKYLRFERLRISRNCPLRRLIYVNICSCKFTQHTPVNGAVVGFYENENVCRQYGN